jgi:hypothetical protein
MGGNYKFNTESEVWTTLVDANLSTRPSWKAVYNSIDNTILIFGSGQSNGGLILSVYDIATNTMLSSQVQFTTGDELNNFGLLYTYNYNNVVYIFGNCANVNIIYTYNLTTKVFALKQTVGGTVWAYDGSVVNWFTCLDKVIVMPDGNSGDASTWEYDITKSLFTNLGQTIPHTGSYLCLAAPAWSIGSKGYLYGGINASAAMSIYDFNTKTWSAGPLTTPIQLTATTVVVSKGNVYLMGLNTSTGVYSDVVKKFSYYLDKPTAITAQYDNITGSITLSWVDNTTEETCYIVERKADNDPSFTQIANIPVQVGTAYSYVDDTVDILNHSYQYQIKARLVMV